MHCSVTLEYALKDAFNIATKEITLAISKPD